MTDDTTSTASPAPAIAAQSPVVESPPETVLQELIGDLHAVLAKLENFEHAIAGKVKSGIETIINDIKEHI